MWIPIHVNNRRQNILGACEHPFIFMTAGKICLVHVNIHSHERQQAKCSWCMWILIHMNDSRQECSWCMWTPIHMNDSRQNVLRACEHLFIWMTADKTFLVHVNSRLYEGQQAKCSLYMWTSIHMNDSRQTIPSACEHPFIWLTAGKMFLVNVNIQNELCLYVADSRQMFLVHMNYHSYEWQQAKCPWCMWIPFHMNDSMQNVLGLCDSIVLWSFYPACKAVKRNAELFQVTFSNMYFNFFYKTNNAWHFLWIVWLNSYEMSSLISFGKTKKDPNLEKKQQQKITSECPCCCWHFKVKSLLIQLCVLTPNGWEVTNLINLWIKVNGYSLLVFF